MKVGLSQKDARIDLNGIIRDLEENIEIMDGLWMITYQKFIDTYFRCSIEGYGILETPINFKIALYLKHVTCQVVT